MTKRPFPSRLLKQDRRRESAAETVRLRGTRLHPGVPPVQSNARGHASTRSRSGMPRKNGRGVSATGRGAHGTRPLNGPPSESGSFSPTDKWIFSSSASPKCRIIFVSDSEDDFLKRWQEFHDFETASSFGCPTFPISRQMFPIPKDCHSCLPTRNSPDESDDDLELFCDVQLD